MASGGIYALKTIDKSVARTQRSRNYDGNSSNSSQNTLDHQGGPPRYFGQNQNFDQGYWGPPPGAPATRGYSDFNTQGRTGYGYGSDGVYSQPPGYSYVQGPPPRSTSRSKKGKKRSVTGEKRKLVSKESKAWDIDEVKTERHTENELRNRTRCE
ncbi:hypothetical protein IFR05_007752 [Cadophora sp. M221]|nr:hypothetical protein IFR05_007752 [Cadophora sp. M221]